MLPASSLGVALSGFSEAASSSVRKAAAGLLRLQGWARPLAYLFAAALALGWIYAVWQVARRGWPYPDVLGTVLSLIPGVLLLSLCAGGAWIVHRQYRRRGNES